MKAVARKHTPGIEIKLGRGNKLVVFEIGKMTGVDYLFRRGEEMRKETVREQAHENEEDAAAEAADDASEQSGGDEDNEDEANGDEEAEGEDEAEGCSVASDTDEESDNEDCSDDAATRSTGLSRGSPCKAKQAWGASPAKRSRAGGSSVSGRSAQKRNKKEEEASDEQPEDEDSEDEERMRKGGKPNTPNEKSKLTKAERAIVKAEELVTIVSKKHTPTKMYEGKVRARGHSSTCNRLSAHAQRLGTFIGNVDCIKMSERLFAMQESLQLRWQFLFDLKNHLATLVQTSMTPSMLKVCRGFSPQQASTMLTTASLDIMKLHRDNWHLALRLAPFFPEGTECNFFSCSLLRGDGDGILLAETTQTTVVQPFGLALFKQSEAADIDAILQKSFDDCGLKIDEVDTDSLDVKTMAVCSDGFFPQAKMDMKAMDVMAKVLLKKNVTSALRNMVRKLLANRNKMSTPFRSLTSTRGSGDKKTAPTRHGNTWSSSARNARCRHLCS